MKIRNDYVSNSSSSSFIIGENEIFNNFNITKQDILDALIDAYGVANYEQAVENCKKSCDEHSDTMPRTSSTRIMVRFISMT